ncbi:DUF485 domain-containing protein [Microvirga guangxiensis]|uniref:Uncharacterized membrane protein, DUF485 family n=1 Tax=Microvirga guangxiensis TaxID=549386 RepID=A0A1G5LLU2_9HYPH|nr:DUF485 domain-containing protein [Microvirga guangxiensis]SCZ13875.1 Uncharacterized membrane protein, DUF485 family [Microvirga guangxiensis]
MAAQDYNQLLRSPQFQELVRQRSKFAWTLSIAMLVIYFGFILLVAFAKPLLATKVGDGVTSLGIILGLSVILSAFVLTGIYVQRANSRFDELTRHLTREIM